MIKMSEEEILRNYVQIYKKLDYCRDENIQIKQDIFNLLHDTECFMLIQPADERNDIEDRLAHMSKQLLYTYYSIKMIKTITDEYIMSNRTSECTSMKILLTHTEKRFRYALERHRSNVEYAQNELGIYTQIPAFA